MLYKLCFHGLKWLLVQQEVAIGHIYYTIASCCTQAGLCHAVFFLVSKLVLLLLYSVSVGVCLFYVLAPLPHFSSFTSWGRGGGGY